MDICFRGPTILWQPLAWKFQFELTRSKTFHILRFLPQLGTGIEIRLLILILEAAIAPNIIFTFHSASNAYNPWHYLYKLYYQYITVYNVVLYLSISLGLYK